MTIRFIIVADGAECRIFKRNSLQLKLELVESFTSADKHKLSHQLGSDRPGRVSDSMGSGHHAIEPKMDLHKKVKLEFIKMIVDNVHNHFNSKGFVELVLVAPSQILGVIRDDLNKNIKIYKTIRKDLTKATPEDIISYLDE